MIGHTASVNPGIQPVPILSHVTSSYHSAPLGRSFALALIKNGCNLIGQTLTDAVGDQVVKGSSVRPCWPTPEGTAAMAELTATAPRADLATGVRPVGSDAHLAERFVAAEPTAAPDEAFLGEPGLTTGLSANRTTFELDGPSARKVLEKGCPLDLHPRSFATGTAYVTLIGSVVIVWKTGDEQYRILPRSSFADFVGRWLIDAMAEFRAPELP